MPVQRRELVQVGRGIGDHFLEFGGGGEWVPPVVVLHQPAPAAGAVLVHQVHQHLAHHGIGPLRRGAVPLHALGELRDCCE